MKKPALIVLRLGLGVTFAWIGVLIFMDPLGWGSTARPWAVRLLPMPLGTFMLANAAFDALVGVLLLLGPWPWLVAAVGALHILAVLAAVGVTDATVRDVGLIAACVALAWETFPEGMLAKLRAKSTPPTAMQDR